MKPWIPWFIIAILVLLDVVAGVAWIKKDHLESSKQAALIEKAAQYALQADQERLRADALAKTAKDAVLRFDAAKGQIDALDAELDTIKNNVRKRPVPENCAPALAERDQIITLQDDKLQIQSEQLELYLSSINSLQEAYTHAIAYGDLWKEAAQTKDKQLAGYRTTLKREKVKKAMIGIGAALAASLATLGGVKAAQ